MARTWRSSPRASFDAVLAESDLDDDEVTLLAIESAWVRRRGVRYSSGVDEIGGGTVSRPEKGLLGLEG